MGVYLWADGLYFGCRLSDDRPCVLVLMGTTQDKELIAVIDSQRESEASWTAALLDLKDRGLIAPPKLATGDGSLGFWLALAKGVPPDPPPAVLGAQDGQCAEQAAQEPARRGAGCAARDLNDCDQRRCNHGVCQIHRQEAIPSMRPSRFSLRH
jgi:hypothetical protein